MLKSGYRPAASDMHKTVFEVMEAVSEEPYKGMIAYFDRARRKRHRTLYNEVGLVSREEASELLKLAKAFLGEMDKKLRK